MNDSLGRMLANMRAFFSQAARCSPGGRVLELDGVAAMIVPAAPDRSVVNSVVYERTVALLAALDVIAGAYNQAGVRAWTVWVPAADAEAAAGLEAAGNVLDASPAAMVLDLSSFSAPVSGTLETDPDPDIADLAGINDEAYAAGGDFAAALAAFRSPQSHLYLARSGGEPACGLITLDQDGDCGVYLVATRAEARGRGLATALMARALTEARERGCRTSSLQATEAGRPVYERLGYRDLGPIEMWERRRPT